MGLLAPHPLDVSLYLEEIPTGPYLALLGSSLVCLLGSTPSYEGKLVRRIDLKSDGPLTLVTPKDVLKLSELRAEQQYNSSRAKRTIRSLYSTFP